MYIRRFLFGMLRKELAQKALGSSLSSTTLLQFFCKPQKRITITFLIFGFGIPSPSPAQQCSTVKPLGKHRQPDSKARKTRGFQDDAEIRIQ
jgi:hypothetical protein